MSIDICTLYQELKYNLGKATTELDVIYNIYTLRWSCCLPVPGFCMLSSSMSLNEQYCVKEYCRLSLPAFPTDHHAIEKQ